MARFFSYNIVVSGLFADDSQRFSLRSAFEYAVEHKIPATLQKNIYMIIDPSVVDEDWYCCALIQARPKDFEELDTEEARLQKGTIDKFATKALMFINFGYSIILIQERHIRQEYASIAFSQILSNSFKANNLYPELELRHILTQDDFMSELQKFQVIYNAKIKLDRPNPKYGETWKPIFDDMKMSNSEKYGLEADSSNGINIDQMSLILRAIYMIEDGYGEGLFRGKDENGLFKTLKTRDIKKEKVDIDIFDINAWPRVLSKYYSKLKARFLK